MDEEIRTRLTACVAMSLYQFNVNPMARAEKLYKEFDGQCAEMDEMLLLVDYKHWATQMAMPTAKMYLEHALERYGFEARQRVDVNLGHA